MARPRDRFFALFGAILFLVTSSALTIAVIYSASQDNKKQDSSADTSDTSQQEATVNPDSNKQLAGTKLENFNPLAKIDKLEAQDSTPGTGDEVKAGDTVTVDYTGAVAATGVIFQSSKDSGQQVSFGLNQVIKGWTDGIPGMKVGGTRRLLIPAALAYGGNPPSGSGIPANADLVFDVTLYKVTH